MGVAVLMSRTQAGVVITMLIVIAVCAVVVAVEMTVTLHQLHQTVNNIVGSL